MRGLTYRGSPQSPKWRLLAPLLQLPKRTRRASAPFGQESAMTFLAKLLKNESGVTAIEYGLIAALIAVVAIPIMGSVGNKSVTTYDKVNAGLKAN
jgi:pilus assembly protein Flp/PilA